MHHGYAPNVILKKLFQENQCMEQIIQKEQNNVQRAVVQKFTGMKSLSQIAVNSFR